MLENLRSLGNYGSNGITDKTLCVMIGFSGLGDTLEESTMKNRDMDCQIYLNRTYLYFFVVVTTK